MKLIKVGGFLTAFVLLSLIFYPSPAHAATQSFTANISWDEPSCTGTLNGVSGSANPNAYDYGISKSDSVNLTINNTSSTDMTVTINYPYSTFTVSANGTYSILLSDLQSQDVMTAQAATTGCTQTSDATLDIDPGTGSLNCNLIDDNANWDVTGSFSNTVSQVSLYEGTQVASGGAVNNSSESVDGTYPVGSSPVTFYLYNGPDSSAVLLAQTTCQPLATSTTMPTTTTTTPSSSATTGSDTISPPANLPNITTEVSSHVNTKRKAGLTAAQKKLLIEAGFVILLALIVLVIVPVIGMWKTFKKAGKPGWAAIVPVYGAWIIYEMGGQSGFWSLLLLVPLLNLIAVVMLVIAELEIAKRFGKNGLFGFFGLFLFSFIGWTILGFSDASIVHRPSSKD